MKRFELLDALLVCREALDTTNVSRLQLICSNPLKKASVLSVAKAVLLVEMDQYALGDNHRAPLRRHPERRLVET